jgi:hypothetical protein
VLNPPHEEMKIQGEHIKERRAAKVPVLLLLLLLFLDDLLTATISAVVLIY